MMPKMGDSLWKAVQVLDQQQGMVIEI